MIDPIYMLGWNQVADFERWKRLFDEDRDAQREAGLELVHLWQDREDPNRVFYLFQAQTIELARAFLGRPEATQRGTLAGVQQGQVHFLHLCEGKRDVEEVPPVRGLR